MFAAAAAALHSPPAATRSSGRQPRTASGPTHRTGRRRAHRHPHRRPARHRPRPVRRPQLAHHNATVVSIDGIGQVNPNGTQTVSPSTSTNFHLVAKGDGGTTEANVRVTVAFPSRPRPADAAPADMGSDAAFHQNVQDIFFDYDSYDLRPDAQTAATKAAAYLVAHPNIRIVIGGYCDDRGSAEYNLALGENRANAAKTALVNAGVAATRIRVVSYGKEKQFCTEETESCWQQNRRAQFSLDR